MDDVNRRKSVAQEILRSSRNRVYLDLRFLETSLFRLTPEENPQIFWGSYGERLLYEFDVATMDRLKRIDITEDFSVWKQYAYQQGIHAAVTSFLEIN